MCQDTTQVVQSGLASAVGKGFQSWDPYSINTTDVDNASWVARRGSLLQQGGEKPGEVEYPMEVEREYSCPGRGGIFIVRSAPVGSRVVDENMQL